MIETALLTFALLWAALQFGAAALVRLWRAPLRRLAPAPRGQMLSALVILPPLAALAVTAGLFVPGLEARLVSPHCHAALACTPHLPAGHRALPSLPALLMPVLAGLYLLWLGGQVRCYRRDARRIAGLPATEDADGLRWIDDERPIALTAGLWRPVIYLSCGLARRLTASELAVVVAHERAHRRRRDNLRQLLARLLLLPSPGSALLDDWRECAEQAADLAAARTAGGRCLVAATLVKVQRLAQRSTRAYVAGFADAGLERRVAALLGPLPAATPGRLWPALLGGGLLLALLAISPLHHAIEWALALAG